MNIEGGRGRGGRRKPMAEINVVPYIDVSLVLLIIFMVTAPMLQTGVDVDLPQATAKPIPDKNEPPLIISINQAGELFLDISNRSDQPISIDELAEKIMAVLSEKPDTSVMIRGDKAVDYGKVVTVMATLKHAGVPNVGLVTSPTD